MSSKVTKGIYLALCTAFISGVSNFVNKIAVSLVKPPLVFTAEKNLYVGLAIVGLLIFSWKFKEIKKLSGRDVLYLTLIGIIGGSIPFYLFFTGLSMIPAVNGAIIHKTLFIWVAILTIPLLKEKVSKLQILGVALLFFANFFIGGFIKFQFSAGELLVLSATLLWAVENILAKKILPHVDADIVVAARMGLGSIILMAAAFILAPAATMKGFNLSEVQWTWMAITVALLLGYTMTWYRALKLAPATTVASVLVSATLITNILSAIFITHAWDITMGIQILLTTLGIGLFWLSSRKTLATHLTAKS
ncbi:MAG: DMT family transporter [Candidatus Levyibacteriota bacterium]